MIDLHCHLLPGIDDGAQSQDDTVALARYAVEHGISHSILTPHLHFARFENFADDIAIACSSLQEILLSNDIELKLGFAAEVRVCPEIMFWVEQNKIPFYGTYDGYSIMLLEMPHNQVSPGIDNMIRWLLSRNIRPMIAHPERNKEIMANPTRVLPLVNAGALIQLTAGAVAGDFGNRCFETADYILKQGVATVLATDAHNIKHRPPDLESGRKQAETIIGESASWGLVLDVPEKIVADQFH